MRIFRDPLHNIIQFDKDEDAILLELIDTAEFQRLRHIKQLGLSSLTYPGAEHTRFAHSLGATHLMRRFIDKLCSLKGAEHKIHIEELKRNTTLALIAALLHDIGHGPFSHALEKTTGIKHERWTIACIVGDTEINSVLHKHGICPSEVAEVIQRIHPAKAVVKLLSSQLDVDRIDYLLRDSLMTGAGYGTFDLEWLINVLTIGEVNGEVEVGLQLTKGKSIAEDFVMARYYMYQHVYFHKATKSAETMIDAILKRAKELYRNNDEIDMPVGLMKLLDVKDDLNDVLQYYLILTDNTIWYYISIWKDHHDDILQDLCTRLLSRRLFKSIRDSDIELIDFLERVFEISDKEKINKAYYFLRDDAKSSSYKDSYVFHTPKTDESETEKEASERIILFDHHGEGFELSTRSAMINVMRNKQISASRYFFPEYLKAKILGGDQSV